jgi:hypothetical protein
MTATVEIYNMPKVTTLTLVSSGTGASQMNYPMNTTEISLLKGVTNDVYFFVKDVDRKPVTANAMANANISNVRIVITDPNATGNAALLLGSQLPPMAGDPSYLVPAPNIDAAKGCWMFTANSSLTYDWPISALNYSIICDRISGGPVMLYTDRNYNPKSNIYMLPGPFPGPSETIYVSNNAFVQQGMSIFSGPYPGAAQIGNLSGQHSMVANVAMFTGSISVQASLENQAPTEDTDWFEGNITSTTAGTITNPGTVTINVDQSDPVYISFQGNYMWVRFIVYNNVMGGGYFFNLDYRND